MSVPPFFDSVALVFPRLAIVFLFVDVSAGAVLPSLKIDALFSGHFAVGFRRCFCRSGLCLLGFELCGLFPCQLSALNPTYDSSLLAMLAPVDAGRCRLRHRERADA